jgi:hypothetical protein
MVLDNQTATLQVGDQIPVTTRQAVSVEDPLAPVVSSIQMRNTGVILRVTPQVNAGGMVTMKIEQEVSDVAPSETPTTTPTIFQRTISSKVAVMSGESVALGGLISESTRNAKSGVPILSAIPILGALFSSTTVETRRTELLVLITPRVVSNQVEARMVTDDIRRRMGRVASYIREKKLLKSVADRDTPGDPAVAAGTATTGRTSSAHAIADEPPLNQANSAAAATGRPKTEPAELRMPEAQVTTAATGRSTPATAGPRELKARVAAATAGRSTPATAEPRKLKAQVAAATAGRPKTQPAEPRMPEAQFVAANPADDAVRAPAYFLHLASYYTKADAVRGWQELSEMYPYILESLQPAIQRADVGELGIFVRLKAGPIKDKSTARALCQWLESKEQYCRVFGG